MHLAVDQNLASLRSLAQSGCEIYDRADRRILEPAFKADPPERSIAIGNSDAEAEAIAELAPALNQVTDGSYASPPRGERLSGMGPDTGGGH